MEIYPVDANGNPIGEPQNTNVNVSEPCEEMSQEEAMGFLNNLTNFFKSGQFARSCNSASKKTGIPPKEIAKGFISKLLGTIGDILGIGVNVIRSTATSIVDILTAIIKGAVNTVCNVANGLARIVTLNKTACCD